MSDSHDTKPPPTTNKPLSKTCHECFKKIPLTSIECRCGYSFCGVHRYHDKHNCKFNYVVYDAEILKKENQPVIAEWLEKF